MLHPADWTVIAAYFAVVIGIGVVVARRVRGTGDYFMGGRGFGRWLMIGQSFGVGTHAEMPVSLAGAVVQHGLSAIWFQWKNLFATPFFWLFAPVLRRVRRTTVAELFEERYGRWMGGIYAVYALVFFTIGSAAMLKGGAKVVSQAAGGAFSPDAVMLSMTAVFIAYSFVGGLVASAWTDFFQGFLIIALSFLLLPLGWDRVGGLEGMRATLGDAKFSLAVPDGIGPWFILMLTVNGLVGILAQPQQMAAVGTGRDERACREGFFWGNYVKRVCTVGWALVGLMVAAMLARGTFGATSLADSEEAFGFACRHLLFPGSLGLLIACVLAANMSTSSAFMVSSGALFTEGIYRRHLVSGRPDAHYLLVGRLSGLAISLLGVAYAYFLIDRVLHAFLLTETMATYMGVGLLGGVIWPRANRWGALASVLAAYATNFGAAHALGRRFDHWDPDVFAWSLLAGVVALVVVSLLTPPEPATEQADLRRRLETPTELPGREGDPVADPAAAAAAAEAGRRSVMVDLQALRTASHGRGWRAYREDLVGFLASWGWVLGLLGAFWLWLR